MEIFDQTISDKQRVIFYILNNIDKKSKFTFSDIMVGLNFLPTKPLIRDFLRKLLEYKYFIQVESTKNGYPRYKLDMKKFRKDYEQSILFKQNTTYIKNTRWVWDNI